MSSLPKPLAEARSQLTVMRGNASAPFADERSAVVRAFQHFRDGDIVRRERMVHITANARMSLRKSNRNQCSERSSFRLAMSHHVIARHQRTARRRTDSVASIHVGEAAAFFRHRVE